MVQKVGVFNYNNGVPFELCVIIFSSNLCPKNWEKKNTHINHMSCTQLHAGEYVSPIFGQGKMWYVGVQKIRQGVDEHW